ncbi:uncharacterized protein LOC143869458 [Tasmannia lanceolata]|uniref:uncharacterized protein LOC143869458 n=1 Tax=Tasmannia lanceolata TaxID=3420 RepID=UPI0040629997
MSETNNTTLLEDSSDEIDEPKLSYERILNDLANIIRTDSITSSCLHSKFFAIGTLYGRIHVFDHQGNKVHGQDLCVHLKSVSCISIDEKGEYLVSCSSDRLVVYGLCDSEHNFVLMPDKPMNVVAIDPNFHCAGSGRRFVAGDDRVVLYERGFLARYKSTVLQTKEQKVRTLSWKGQFIAWATDLSVQIFDIEQRAIITRIKRESDLDGSDPCQFSWKDKRTLLIGWGNTVKVCLIKERSHEILNDTQLKELPRKYVEIVSMFETDFTVCGLSPFSDSLLTLSINYPDGRQRRLSRDTQSSCDSSLTSIPSSNASSDTTHNYSMTQSSEISSSSANQQASTINSTTSESLIRPQVHILDTYSNSYNEVSKDVLTPNGCLSSPPKKTYPTNHQHPGGKSFPYNLLSLHNEGIYFIVCPKDVISAKPRDNDDHIDWLIQHSMIKECYQFAKEKASDLNRHSLREVEEIYVSQLLDKATPESYSEAARLCVSICGKNQKSWDDEIHKFCHLNQLKHLLPYLPKNLNGFHLKEESYNFILNEFLKNDSVSFFRAIKEIPCQLYTLQTMTDQVIKNLSNDPKNLVLNEALAELYTQMGSFEDAVNIYLDYNDKTRIFSLIRNNNLVNILRDRVDRLMQIDANETSQLLVENIETIPMRDVVARLERDKSQRYLVSYLHRLVLKDPDSCVEYHDLMVRLYAQHQRESLLSFLKLSTDYRLEGALEVCKGANMIKEVVFLYGRMGDLRTALKYIMESQDNINESIEFCKEHQDSELWKDLIAHSMARPEYIGELLKNIGTDISDPKELIDRIPNGCEIEGLMPALVKILRDYQLQISLERSCRDLMARDCFALLEKQIRCQTQGIGIKADRLCDHCNQSLFSDALVDNLSQTRSVGTEGSGSATGGGSVNLISGTTSSRSNQQSGSGGNSLNDLVVFGCHHVFHEECCTDSTATTLIDADMSTKMLTCRVCMLEKDYDGQLNN